MAQLLSTQQDRDCFRAANSQALIIKPKHGCLAKPRVFISTVSFAAPYATAAIYSPITAQCLRQHTLPVFQGSTQYRQSSMQTNSLVLENLRIEILSADGPHQVRVAVCVGRPADHDEGGQTSSSTDPHARALTRHHGRPQRCSMVNTPRCR